MSAELGVDGRDILSIFYLILASKQNFFFGFYFKDQRSKQCRTKVTKFFEKDENFVQERLFYWTKVTKFVWYFHLETIRKISITLVRCTEN